MKFRPIAIRSSGRYILASNLVRTREIMRAEVERLVEEIKQSVGLLRRHL
jgi:hypothetical protein